jgi:hypothetical protein
VTWRQKIKDGRIQIVDEYRFQALIRNAAIGIPNFDKLLLFTDTKHVTRLLQKVLDDVDMVFIRI